MVGMMKHKMNKHSKYYEGPDGVFYDFKHDDIFELEYAGGEIYNIKIHKIVGKRYWIRSCKCHKKQVGVTGMTNVIRLGEL